MSEPGLRAMSLLGFFLHGVVLGDTGEATPYWLVSVPIVAMGAPFGAFVAAHLPQRLLISAILLLAMPVAAQADDATVSGQVLLPEGATLEGAAAWTVLVEDTSLADAAS